MKYLKGLAYVIYLLLTSLVMVGHPIQARASSATSEEAKLFVRDLYAQVVVRRPIGIPKGDDWNSFMPFLSASLIGKLNSAKACNVDWHRQYPSPSLKPEIGWLELGIFSGDDENAGPTSFVLERIKTASDHSFHAYVKLSSSKAGENPWSWPVEIVIRSEDGHLKVVDILYIDESSQNRAGRLTKILSAGCSGSHWIGFSKNQK